MAGAMLLDARPFEVRCQRIVGARANSRPEAFLPHVPGHDPGVGVALPCAHVGR